MHKIVTIFLFMLKYALVLIDLTLGLRMDFFCSVPFMRVWLRGGGGLGSGIHYSLKI